MATPSKKGGTESDQLLSEFNSTYDAITSMLESLKAGPGDTPPPPQQQQQQQQPQQQPQLPRAASAFGARSLQRRRSSAAEAPAATAVRPRTAAGFGGAPRALVDKIDMYRSSKEARRELAARLQAESGADAATTSGINRGINFIMANRACLSARGALAAAAPLAGSGGSGGDPFSGSMQDRSWDAVGSRSRRAADVAAAGAAPQQQRVAQASSAGGAGPPAPWAHYDATPPLPSGSSQLAIAVLGGGGGPSGCSTPVAGSGGAAGFRGGAATPGSARPATAGAGGAAGGYGAGSPPPGVGQLNVESAGGQSRLGPGSPTRNSGSSRPGTANASPSHTTSRPGTANASPSRPGTASGRPATGSRRPSFLERGASPFHGFTASFPSTPAGRLRPGSACPSPNAARRLTLEGWEAAGGGSTGGSNPDSPGDFRLEHKALRVVLTSRPAAGGSPTALPSFLEEQQYLVERRNEHGEEVRERYAKQTEDKIAQIAWSAGGRQRKAEEEAARRAANAEMVEIERRRNTWLGVTNVSAKLVFVVEQLIKDRAARPWRTIQKRAALTIAIWYKRVLLLRRQRQMVTLIMTLNRLMRNTAGGIRERVRSSSAHRIVALMQVRVLQV
ncbi:hypothetical protein FOA52_001051 [Chlamydomonas sp. UWO 241]|nr:hypothetical protein FOA52_001051 [Chlamydomonas sp. UWO 241]